MPAATEPVAPETHTIAHGALQVILEVAHAFAELNRILSGGKAKPRGGVTDRARSLRGRTGAVVIAIAPGDVDGKAKETKLTQSLGMPVRIEVEAPALPRRSGSGATIALPACQRDAIYLAMTEVPDGTM